MLTALVVIGSVFVVAHAAAHHPDPERHRRRTVGAVLVFFGALKLLDLDKFAAMFRKYDLVAAALPAYAHLYPLLELGAGADLLLHRSPRAMPAVHLMMNLQLLGVALALLRGRRDLLCGCMGSAVRLPLSQVTLLEAVAMKALLGGGIKG